MITCFIRYQIDPFKADQFAQYARGWTEIIPRCGADLHGYFGPHEGSATTAYALLSLPDLAAYEAYRARLRADADAQQNFDFARRERVYEREDRIFLRKITPL